MPTPTPLYCISLACRTEDEPQTSAVTYTRSVFPQVPTAEMLGDDAEVELKRKVPDALVFTDDEFVPTLLRNLNTMRKNKQFCDVILQVCDQSVS